MALILRRRINMAKTAIFTLEIWRILPYIFGTQQGARMPTVARFDGFEIVVYFRDHNPPHVHVVSPDDHALVAIATAEIFRGALPPGFRAQALSFVTEHRSELLAMDGVSEMTDAEAGTVRVDAVRPGNGPFRLRVEWADGSKSSVDLAGLVYTSEHFRVFENDRAAFRDVGVVHYGTGIGWKNGLDYSAETLKTLADEQKPLSGKSFRIFERKYALNTAETAALLDIAERTVREYRRSPALPERVAIAVRRLDSDPTVFAAHYRPIPKKERGRPRKAAG